MNSIELTLTDEQLKRLRDSTHDKVAAILQILDNMKLSDAQYVIYKVNEKISENAIVLIKKI